MTSELETCDECGRTFRDRDTGADVDEMLCPRCKAAKAERHEPAKETEEEMEGLVAGALTDVEPDLDVRTFAETGVLTMNRGLTVRTAAGAEFQITIVRSR